MAMKGVLIRIRQYRAHASGAEHGALDFILENPEQAAQMNIHELAIASFSSSSTLVRLCRKLGFEGYRDFQKSLIYELANRKDVGKQLPDSSKVQTLSDIIDSVSARNIASIEDTSRLVEQTALAESVELLHKADRILFFGMGASYLVADDAFLKFMRVGKTCFCCEDVHSQYVLATNSDPHCVAVIISYSGMTDEMLHCAGALSANGTPIIAITKFETSPLAKLATCCLYVAASEELFRSGAMSSRIAQLNMIDILFSAYINTDNHSEIIHLLEKTQIKKTPVPR